MRLFRSLLVVIMATNAGSSYAEAVAAAPDAKTWADSLNKNNLQRLKSPLQVVLLERFHKRKKKPIIEPVKFDHSACERVSYISCVAPSNFRYGVLINKIPFPPTDDVLMNLSLSNGLIYNEGKKVWFKALNSKAAIPIEGIQSLSKTIDPKSLFEALLTTLGYDAVVLAIKDDFLLVGSLESRLQRSDLQGLLVQKSANKFSVKSKDPRKGAALITMVNQHGAYAVFKTVIENDSSGISIGQKVILEGSSAEASDESDSPQTPNSETTAPPDSGSKPSPVDKEAKPTENKTSKDSPKNPEGSK